METASYWQSFVQAADEAIAGIAGFVPLLVAAIVILAAGWGLARIGRTTAKRLLNGLNRLLGRWLAAAPLSALRLPSIAVIILAEATYWLVILVALTVAAQVVGFTALTVWLNRAALLLPDLLLGAGITIVGYFVSLMVGEQVTSGARAARAGQAVLMGKTAQGAIFATAVIVGLDQIGVDVTFLVALFAVTVGAVCIGFSIAFGLGAP